MTTDALIAALEAVTADSLELSDDATLDRLRNAAERLETLVFDEQERRSPMEGLDLSEIQKRGR